MPSAPRTLRLHIGLFGRRNAGKSSLLNALTGQAVSLVSPEAGTTTDPVEKPMELLPFGPVLFMDTAGLDDEGTLGLQRVARSRALLDRVDLALLVAEAGAWGPFEEDLLAELKGRGLSVVVALNKADLAGPAEALQSRLAAQDQPAVVLSATTGAGLDALREALLRAAPAGFLKSRHLLSDLVPAGRVAVLVMPIDSEAPKGRLILPQVMAVRDLLDGHALALVVQEGELTAALEALKHPPALVVTDSQAFQGVAARVPEAVPLTSFSILLSRFHGFGHIAVHLVLLRQQLVGLGDQLGGVDQRIGEIPAVLFRRKMPDQPIAELPGGEIVGGPTDFGKPAESGKRPPSGTLRPCCLRIQMPAFTGQAVRLAA